MEMETISNTKYINANVVGNLIGSIVDCIIIFDRCRILFFTLKVNSKLQRISQNSGLSLSRIIGQWWEGFGDHNILESFVAVRVKGDWFDPKFWLIQILH